MKAYFLSVICGAILCGIVTSLLEKNGASGKLLKLISGTVLTFTVLAPIAEVKLEDMTFLMTDVQEEGEAVASMGRTHSVDAMAVIIKRETEAYILDKARELQADLDICIFLDGDLKPSSVTLQGRVSGSNRQKIEHMITRDLGIPKEDQIWKVS
jgi:hypothetical protein